MDLYGFIGATAMGFGLVLSPFSYIYSLATGLLAMMNLNVIVTTIMICIDFITNFYRAVKIL